MNRHIPKDNRISTITCNMCGKEFQRRFTWGSMPKYCSDECRKKVSGRQKSALKNIEKNCLVCGNVFLTDKWKVKTKKYCSRECCWRYHGKNGGTVQIACTTCGKTLKRNPSNVGKNNYCGYSCMAKGKTLDAPRTNGVANVRAWFGRFNRMSECEKCGYDKVTGILVLHHKDRDRTNNHLSNLAVLCPNCHAIEHMAEHKNNWKGHESTNPIKIAARLKVKERKKNVA